MMKKLLFVCFAIPLMLSGCEDYSMEVPDYEEHGNILALLTPGEELEIQVAITGVDLQVIENPARVETRLFKNDTLVDEFHLKGDHIIEWGRRYRLETVIDGEFSLSSEVQLPDSLQYQILDTVELAEPVFGRSGQRYNYRKPVFIKAGADIPVDSLYFHEDQHSTSSSTELISNDASYFSVAATGDTLNYYTLLREGPLNITFIGREYFLFLRSADVVAEVGRLSPQPVSYSNISGGAGLMSLYYPLTL